MTTTTKERPILFNGAMVRAILAGTKTMTRRVVKPQPEFTEPDTAWEFGVVGHAGTGWYAYSGEYPDEGSEHYRCPYGQPGDRLWVKETWRTGRAWDNDPPKAIFAGSSVSYDATDAPMTGKTRPSIFMPRWASRITLEVVGVRVERLQEISEEDAKAEGIDEPEPAHGAWCDPALGRLGHWSYRKPLAGLWDSLNAKRGFGWDTNPFVWVVEFRKVAS